MNNQSGTPHPFDTPVSSGLRFLAELLAWTVCTWTAGRVSVLLAILVLVILIGLPALFSTPGDKKQIIVATPGPTRFSLEIALHTVAIACFWISLPTWAAVLSTLIVLSAVIAGIPRSRWLLQGTLE